MMVNGPGLSTDGGGDVRDQVDGVEYRVRRVFKPMLAVGILASLGVLVAVAFKPPGALWLVGAVVSFNFAFWVYLTGPVAVVTVRPDTLEINNVIFRYVIPRPRIVAVEPDGPRTVLVRAEPDWRISISAFESPFAYYIRTPSQQAEEASRLASALAKHTTVDHHREVTRRVRWVNPLGLCLGLIALLVLGFLLRNQ